MSSYTVRTVIEHC